MSVPTSASMAWNRMFCAFQPTVLKASVALMPFFVDTTLDELLASMKAVFAASTSTAPRLVTVLPTICALAWDRTRLVAMMPPAAIASPLPLISLPPVEVTSLSLTARTTAASSAETVTLSASTAAVFSSACAPARRSLRTTSMPKAKALSVDTLTSGIIVPAVTRSQ